MPGEEYVCALGEFSPGDFHAVDCPAGVRTLRTRMRPPNLIGRVLRPPRPAASREPLEPLPPEGLPFEADASGNVVEMDDALVERCWGVEAAGCYGYGFINHVAPELRARFCADWAAAVMVGATINLRTEAVRADEARVPLVVLAVPARRLGGGYSGVTRPGKVVRVA